MAQVRFVCKTCKKNVSKDELDFLRDPNPHEGHDIAWFARPSMEAPEEISPEVSADDTVSLDSDVKSLRGLVSALNGILFEREEAIKVLTLGLLAREHIIYYGEPGTAKSAMAESFSSCIEHSFFEYEINQGTTDAELFGPFDIGVLRNESKMRRNIEDSILTAEIAFLDEIGNSSSMIRNALKRIMQGRNFSVGGRMVQAPLQLLVAASNSVLEYEDPTEHAFEDRFLFRYEVLDIMDRINLAKMFALRDNPNPSLPHIDHAVVTRLQSYVNQVEMGESFYLMFADFLLKLQADAPAGVTAISSRRKRKMLSAVAANAVLNGRKKANKSDLGVLSHIVWNNPNQRVEIDQWLSENIISVVPKIENAISIIEQIMSGYRQLQDNATEFSDRYRNGILSKPGIEAQISLLKGLANQVEDQEETDMLSKAIALGNEYIGGIAYDLIDIKHDDGTPLNYEDVESLKK